MKKLIVVACAMAIGSSFAQPSVTDVTAKQRYPWNGLVDIKFTVSGMDENDVALFAFSTKNVVTGELIEMRTVTKDTATGVDMYQQVATNGDYHVIWDAGKDIPNVKISEISTTVDLLLPNEDTALWEGGVTFAKANVGATDATDPGLYFWWGDTVGYQYCSEDGTVLPVSATSGGVWTNLTKNIGIVFSNTDPVANQTCNQTVAQLRANGWLDATKDVLAADKDTASVNMKGDDWRMPTYQEQQALITNTTAVFFRDKGLFFRGRGAYLNKCIFLPRSGCGYNSTHNNIPYSYAWSSSPRAGGNYHTWFLRDLDVPDDAPRHICLPVRAVR